jgi:hypothetical protein
MIQKNAFDIRFKATGWARRLLGLPANTCCPLPGLEPASWSGPIIPQLQTCTDCCGMSELVPIPDSCAAAKWGLFDHFVGGGYERGTNI